MPRLAGRHLVGLHDRGLRTSVDGEVLDFEGRAIPGLYAAGRTAAIFSGHGYVGSGASLADASFFGRRAGQGGRAELERSHEPRIESMPIHEGKIMIKLVFCCRRKSGMTREAFQKRWLDVHGPLVRKLRAELPMMKRYVQSHTARGCGRRCRERRPARVARHEGALRRDHGGLVRRPRGDGRWIGREGRAAGQRLLEDEGEFVDDFAHSSVFVTEEKEIF